MRIRLLPWLKSSLLLAPLLAHAGITLGPGFKDHAVVQRGKPLPVWGQATPGEKLVVTFRGQTLNTTVDANGRWIVYFEPFDASAEPAELTIAGTETVVVHDVLVGEVWLASGQSNMEWPVSSLQDDEKQIAQTDLPNLRHLRIEHTVAGAPAESVSTSSWESASPQTVGGFTAIGYFFARELQRKLGVPVGIIHSSWGGTAIEAWMSENARMSTALGTAIEARWKEAMDNWPPERVAQYAVEMASWQKGEEEAKATQTKNPLAWPQPPASLDSPARPGGLFNGMIAPLQPTAIRGVLWYQGESNVGRAGEYAELLTAMIHSWRENWGDDSLPFYVVQLPNFANGNPGGREWARLREAQAKILELPAAAVVVAIDLGDPENLHPPTKMELGRRLALAAKSQLYAIPGDYSGPVFESAMREGSTMRVRFTHADSGLVSHHRPVQSLEIAGADHVFHVGVGKIDRNTLVVSSPEVNEPVAVRYAWSNAPAANLYDGSGLPAMPFRSDDW
ncbi:MAG: sialate O-acetylesterase [Opitutus sp.]